MFIAAGGLTAAAHGQVVFSHAPYNVTVEGYANLTGANISTDQALADAKRTTARVDGGLRLLGLYGDAKGLRFGARVEFESAKERRASTGERSLLVLGPWGRVELGKRQGLPDVLSGYAPNTYTFTSAEFGIASGPRLDPGGTLPTLFLPRALAAQINSISILGFANTLFGDRSTKVIYVSPKVRGLEGAASFSPQATDPGWICLAGTGSGWWTRRLLSCSSTSRCTVIGLQDEPAEADF